MDIIVRYLSIPPSPLATDLDRRGDMAYLNAQGVARLGGLSLADNSEPASAPVSAPEARSRSLTFLTYKWKPKPGYHSTFIGEHANILARMIRRHYAGPHRFICYTDDETGIDATLVEAREIWTDYADLADFPRASASCFRRLKRFSRDAAAWLGERIVMMDLDVVIVGDLTLTRPLDRPEDFVINTGAVPFMPYNGSLMLFTAGCRPRLWEDFHPVESLAFARSLRQPHSDDGWIGAKLGPNEARFTPEDGVYDFRNHIRGKRDDLPENAVMVILHGKEDPDGPVAQSYAWVRENYR